jgi:c-di-GMP-binding flagellar brake protein YcgR
MEREEKAAGSSNRTVADTPVDQGTRIADDPRNRRSNPRYSVDEDSMLLLVSHGRPLESHILDLSLDGCRMRTSERFTAGLRMRVEVSFKVNGIAFRFLGVVQWTDGEHLLGIRFVEVISRRREQLAEVICEMEAAAAARAAKKAAESEAQKLAEEQARREAEEQEESQAQEPALGEATQIADREAREWAEIQEIAQRARIARTADRLPLTVQTPVKLNRRAQAPHEVDTTATIFLVKVGSMLRGRILDLSESGCRICCDEPFPVGIYTRVEAEFRLAGLPFLLGGVVQAIHDRRSVSIRFLEVSERKQKQVEQLIARIEEMRWRPADMGEEAMGDEN